MERLSRVVARQRAPLARPGLWVNSVAAVAALMLAVGHLRLGHPGFGDGATWGTGGHAHHDAPADVHGPSLGDAGAGAGDVVVAWGRWCLMVAAMMLPLVAPVVCRLAASGLWARRARTVVEFVGAYLVTWFVVGLAEVSVVERALPPKATAPALSAVLCLSAAWHVAAPRRRLMRRCGRFRPVALQGRQASADCLRVGRDAGGRCIATCGPAMAAMTLSHNAILMCAIWGLLWSERLRGPNPEERVARPRHALGFALLAAAAPVLS